MSGVNVQLNILIDVLNKKVLLLQELFELTKAQGGLLNEEDFRVEVFNELMNQKQERIDQVMNIDDGFKLTYEKIRFQIEGNKELYKEEIQQMKDLIVAVGDLGVAITVQEEKNKNLFSLKSNTEKSKIKDFRKSKQTVANYYNSMNNQKNAERSYFFDSKK
jgi:Tfp pilus assembly protein PilW